ncbi:hypothetical protein [Nesterenkonia sp. CF4.4]|uniref:hypothetical protein n=1 Tax=Nesterenkonia sp. CF4.4 TaxID=3373079 RepID=UPI003EE4945B
MEDALKGGACTDVIDLKTPCLGPEALLVAARIAVRRSDTGADVAQEINDAEKRIRRTVPIVTIVTRIYLEPAIYAATIATPADPD